MLKAGALYFAIVISFFIAIISASLIMLASHYRAAYLKEIRMDRLLNNLSSGISYILNEQNKNFGTEVVELYHSSSDSLLIERKQWGIYDLAIVKAFIMQDTLQKALLIGIEGDSTVLYLSDEDRPLAISGSTRITGNVSLPKSGIRQAYAEGKPYNGKELIYQGKTTNSTRKLIPLNEQLLNSIQSNFKIANRLPLLNKKTLIHSFLDPVQKFSLPQKATLENLTLTGNIILFADSSITIKASCQLKNIQVYAPYIKVEQGFTGNCQLFATDSVVVANKATFNYPSVIGVLKNEKSEYQAKIILGADVKFNGVVFTTEKELTPLQTKISLGKNSILNGEVYCAGFFQLEKNGAVNGKVSCNRFYLQTIATRYENFLIDVELNRKARSRYYVSSRFFIENQPSKILQWLN